MGLVPGVLALNALFAAVGYCALAAPLARRGLRERASWAGLALLVGAGLDERAAKRDVQALHDGRVLVLVRSDESGQAS
jgi:hypothetical protein